MRVAVLGAGYAGVAVARQLEGSLDDAELVVVDDTGTHLVQHELHRVVRRPTLADDIDLPLDELLEEAEVVEDRVTDVDPDEGVAHLVEGDPLEYDVGALCLGAETAFHGLGGVREHGTPLKTIEDAMAVRERFLAVCSEDGSVVVGGAGLSGVQVAGELAVLADEVDVDSDVVLLEQEDRVAPRFEPDFGAAVAAGLADLGVEVRTGTAVEGATESIVELADGTAVDCDQLVWTGGITGGDAAGGERPVVDADLRLGERTVGVGDAVRVVDTNGEAVPASAQSAVRQADTAATNVRRLVEGGDGVFGPRLERFRFESPGWLVSVGDDAVGKVGPTVVTGAAARAMKASVGANYYTSVGAVRKATDLVYEELGVGNPHPEADEDGDGAREDEAA
jgi:NADH dehydrogenase